MIDFVISGSRGFIGGHLLRQLRALGFRAISDNDFARAPEPAAVFVNCANIAASPSATADLLSQKIALARGHVRTFVHLLSFSTLNGRGRLDPTQVNCGLRLRFANLYSAGKLEEERVLLSGSPVAPNLVLTYLPAVLGERGGWSDALTQSRAHGFKLPLRMRRRARANWIDVDDITAFLTGLRAAAPAAGTQRIILNRATSAHTTWADLLSGPDHAQPGLQIKEQRGVTARLREAIVYVLMKAIAFAARGQILVPVDRALRKLKPVKPLTTRIAPSPIPSRPFEFRSLIRALARTQPYIPGHDPAAVKDASTERAA